MENESSKFGHKADIQKYYDRFCKKAEKLFGEEAIISSENKEIGSYILRVRFKNKEVLISVRDTGNDVKAYIQGILPSVAMHPIFEVSAFTAEQALEELHERMKTNFDVLK